MKRINFSFLTFSIFLFSIATISSWAFFFFSLEQNRGFSIGPGLEFITKLVGIELGKESAFLSTASWAKSLRLGFTTLTMSILAIGFAAIFSFLTFPFAARTLAFSDRPVISNPFSTATFLFIKMTHTITRSVPELVWAMLIVFVLHPSVIAGSMALAFHNYGVLGRLLAESVENMNQRPIKALRSSGANSIQILFYCVMPEIFPKFLTYLLYRWEVVIRTTVVVGFLAAGGLGRELKLSMSWFHYDEVGVLLVTYVILVFLVDGISVFLRKYVS